MSNARPTGHAAEEACPATPLRRDTRHTLRQVPLFAGLADETQALLTHGALERRYRRGSWLFSQGEPADRFYVVLEGWVKLFRESPDGNECMVGLFTRGESFAEAAMFDRLGFPVNAAVAEDARLLLFPAEHFLATLRQHHELALNLLANLSGMLRGLIRQLDQLTTQPTYQRLAAFLVTLCPAGAASARVCLPCDKLLIAGRLGMKPESFSRALARLREVGVHSERNCVLIEDVAALTQLAAGGEGPMPECTSACLAGRGTAPGKCDVEPLGCQPLDPLQRFEIGAALGDGALDGPAGLVGSLSHGLALVGAQGTKRPHEAGQRPLASQRPDLHLAQRRLLLAELLHVEELAEKGLDLGDGVALEDVDGDAAGFRVLQLLGVPLLLGLDAEHDVRVGEHVRHVGGDVQLADGPLQPVPDDRVQPGRPVPPVITPPPLPEADRRYREAIARLETWYQQERRLEGDSDFRRLLAGVVSKSLVLDDVRAPSGRTRRISLPIDASNIVIEGMIRRPAVASKARFEFARSQEVFELLKDLVGFEHLGQRSWRFDGGPEAEKPSLCSRFTYTSPGSFRI